MRVRIGDCGRVITGTTPPTKNANYYSSYGYPFITPAELKQTRFVKTSSRYLSDVAHKDFYSRFINPLSVVVDCIGADMGNASIVTDRCLTNQQINAITEINLNIVNPMYLYYLLSTMKLDFHLIGMSGSTMPIISKTLFESIEIDIHDLPVQQHIVDTIHH